MGADSDNGAIEQSFATRHAGSAALRARACEALAGGVAHDTRIQAPFPVMTARAKGARKWDVDGNEIVDYTMGHGALILGHGHPVAVDAAREQLAIGTHYGAGHELEIAWAEQIKRLKPSIERVRFHSSGTEATHMAMRLARAHTGRDRIVKFQGHFHGWHDYATVAVEEPYDIPTSAGVPAATQGTITALPTDLDLVREALSMGEVAAVIVEPSGAGWGALPIDPTFIEGLRVLTTEHDAVLILDEVVTGFRMSSGGFQVMAGVTPDLTTMAKIVAGGLPGAAVGGRADIMDRLEKRGDPAWDRGQRIAHPGTYNANPVSAAAGTAVLDFLADGAVHVHIDALCETLRQGLQETFDRHDVGALVYGETSYFHISLSGQPAKSGLGGAAGDALGQALLNEGVHLISGGGFTSAAHTEADIEQTVAAFDAAIGAVAAEGLFDN